MKINNSSENNQPSKTSKEQSSLYNSLLAMRMSGGDRLEFALKWIETNNSLDDLAFATKRFKTESKQQELVEKWHSVNNLNSSDLSQALENSTIENSLKSKIAVAFLAEEINSPFTRIGLTLRTL